ncbi:MAG: NupC/NupG family nucleoside CNT transporter [Pseudomonadota bacterium]
MSRFSGLLGVVVLLALAVALSSDRRRIRLRTVAYAFALQVAVAGIILYLPYGSTLLSGVVRGVQGVIDYAGDGIDFVFGTNTGDALGFTVAFNVLPVIVFFSALMSVLYYLGIMQVIVAVIGGALARLLGTTRAESMTAASNIFVGHTEAPLVVRPWVEGMSESELFAVMTGGCATIAGAVMAAYASMGVDLNYLLTASFMAAPGGLMMAKIILPPDEAGAAGRQQAATVAEERAVNVFAAVGDGALIGLKLALNVGALLLAFVAMIALVNGIIGGVAGWFGYPDVTLQWLLGKALAPLAFLLGVPWADATAAGSLIGQKFVLNEFFAYANFVGVKDAMSAQAQVVVTFALCGFANLSAIAMLLGGIGAIAPSRRDDVARLGLKAVTAGTLANLMSATLAGLFFALSG